MHVNEKRKESVSGVSRIPDVKRKVDSLVTFIPSITTEYRKL